MRILLTRPELRGDATAAALRARGHVVLHMPLMRIEAIADADLGRGPWDAVAMTSANAAVAISSLQRKSELQNLPIFVVGERTKDWAQRAGFANVQASDGGVDALARFVFAKFPRQQKILYLAGEDRAGDLAGALSKAGHRVPHRGGLSGGRGNRAARRHFTRHRSGFDRCSAAFLAPQRRDFSGAGADRVMSC